jgi:hypothetical protein
MSQAGEVERCGGEPVGPQRHMDELSCEVHIMRQKEAMSARLQELLHKRMGCVKSDGALASLIWQEEGTKVIDIKKMGASFAIICFSWATIDISFCRHPRLTPSLLPCHPCTPL